jgi:hypothetical protein
MRNDDIGPLLADLIEVTAKLEEEVAFLLKAAPRDFQMEHMLAWIIHEFCGEKRKDALKG